MKNDFWRAIVNLKQSKSNYILVLFIIVFIFLSFPDRAGKSLYAYSETLRDLAITRSISQGSPVLLGPISSLGNFHFGPAYYYLLYPFARVTNFALWSLSLASIFYGSLTILLMYYVVKKWWQNTSLALLAAALTATSTLTAQFAVYASNPNLVPLFSLLFFFCLERIAGGTQRPKFYIFLLAFSFGIAIQLHAVPLICLPIILFVVILRKQLKLNIGQWLLFLLVSIATNSLYIFYEFTHKFENIKSLFSISAGSTPYAPFGNHVIQYIGFWISSIISSNDFFNTVLILGVPFCIFFGFVLILLYLIFKYNHKKLKTTVPVLHTQLSVKQILIYWFIVPSLVLLLPLGALNGLRIYYFFILSPMVFIILALGLWQLLYKGYNLTVWYILTIYCILQVGQMYLYHYLVWNLK